MDKHSDLSSPLQQFQQQFCAHIRSKGKVPAPKGTSPLGMRTYRQLVHNNIRGFNDACFPVCRKIIGVRKWQQLLDRYFLDHRGQTPYFSDIPAEFQAWLAKCFADKLDFIADMPAWLAELAHWEWVELDVSLCQQDIQQIFQQKNTKSSLIINPSLSLNQYSWPVHLLTGKRLVSEQNTWLACWRNLTNQICFAELTVATYVLLQLLQQGEELDDCILFLAEKWQRKPSELKQFAYNFLSEYDEKHLLLLHQ